MPTDKQRVTLYLTKDKYERAKKLAARMPGGSVSALVDDLLDEAVETIGAVLDAAEAGDKDAQAEAFSMLLAKQFLNLADEGVGVIRHVKQKQSE